jgi:hypothetical protein
MVKAEFFCLLSLLLCNLSHGTENQDDSWEINASEPFDRSELAKLVNIPRGNIIVQIVNHGNVGFMNSEPRRKSDRVDEAEERETENNSGRKISNNVQSKFFDAIPPPENAAEMARFIVKNSNWTSLATISTREPTVGYPSNNIVSVSDGPVGKSTGVPYMYVTSLDISQKDLQVDPRASLTMTLAQSDYCRDEVLDPEDPRCAHVILTGEFVKIQNGTQEAAFAQEALFSKHPVMPSWPADHGFFFAKLHISNIIVLDYFGGAKTVAPKDYYKANVNRY